MAGIAALLCLVPLPAPAQPPCRAEINSTDLVIDAEALATERGAVDLRERIARWPASGLNRLRGQLPSCDSATLIAFLAREVPEDDIAGYCLTPDPALGYILAPGARDYRGRCLRTTCDRVQEAGDGAAATAARVADIATGRRKEQSRAEAVIHSSGAAIVTGSAGSVLSALGSGATTAVTAALTAPVFAGAAAVSVMTVGGAVYLCSDAG